MFRKQNLNGHIVHPQKNHSMLYAIIIVCLVIALLPAILSNNYLRQDDLKTGIWWGMKISDEGYLYYNTVYQLVRPICMWIFYVIDLLSINMHYAVIVRLASIVNVCILGVLLYRWQLLFNSNRFLALSFAIAAFTLPGIQLATATANYFLMLFGILLTFFGAFYWHKSFNANSANVRKKYAWIGCLFFFSSFLDYPISSMYIWVLLGITYLNSLTSDHSANLRKFFYYGSVLAFSTTVAYFIFMHLFHWMFHVNLSFGRVGGLHLHDLPVRLGWVFQIMVWHALFWVYNPGHPFHYYPLMLIGALLFIALARVFVVKKSQNSVNFFTYLFGTPCVLVILFLLSYSPVLASPDDSISYTFRYTLATMPLLLYVLFWSLQSLTYATTKSFLQTLSKSCINLVLLTITLFGIAYSNMMLADGIVGPQDSDFRFLEAQLNQKVVPLLQQHKLVALHVIDCDHGNNYHFEKGIPTAQEYSMRLCAFPNHLLGAINHSLMVLGFISNRHHPNNAYSDGKIIILNDIPWGNMIVDSNNDFSMEHLDYPKEQMTLVTIDMRSAPAYTHFELYKRLLGLQSA